MYHQISLGPPTGGFNCHHPGSHWVCLLSCSTPSTPRKGRAAAARLKPLPREFTLVGQAPEGQLAKPGRVSPGGAILSNAAAATAPHRNCCLPFAEATVTRTAGDGAKVSRTGQWGGRDRLDGEEGARLVNRTPLPAPGSQSGSWVTQPGCWVPSPAPVFSAWLLGASAWLLGSNTGSWVPGLPCVLQGGCLEVAHPTHRTKTFPSFNTLSI